VLGVKKEERSMRLNEREEKKFEQAGAQVGTALAAGER
jgi:hypothetical protein